jgi:ketosteroid isomerase-like protein
VPVSYFKSAAAAFLITVSAMSTQAVAAPATVPIGELPQASAAEMAEFRSQVDALYRLKVKAFTNKDAAMVVEHFYASDAVALGPDGKPTIGRGSLRKEYEQVVQIGVPKIEPIRAHVGKNAAWEWVNFRVHMNDPKAKDFTFAMVFLFAKKDGKWISGGESYAVGEFPSPR